MLSLFIMAVCLALNAFLSGIEMAFVSVGKPHLRELTRRGNREAARVLSLRDNPERTLSVLQVGITLVGVLAAAVGGAGAEESLSPLLEERLGISENASEFLIILAVTLPYTFLSVILGELVPKSVALKNPSRLILRSSRLLKILDRVFSPVVTFLESSTKGVLRLWDLRSHPEPTPSEEPLDLETLTQEHRQYMLNLFDIRRKSLRDVLIPWEEVVYVDLSTPTPEIAATIYASGHTRLPVLSQGELVGVLNTKEFVVLHATGVEEWQSIIRPPVKLDEEDSLIYALKLMQQSRSHLSIVFSGTRLLGVVAMEDIFEEIIGDIFDEDDDGRLRRILVSRRRDRVLSRPRPPESRPHDLRPPEGPSA